MSDDATQTATSIMQALEAAWNAADGEAFGRAFAEEAYFVDIRADDHQGRIPIAKGHQAILATIYKGSTVQYHLLRARTLAPGVIGAQVGALLHVPAGPLAGESRSVYSLVARQQGAGWQIELFQNTMVPPEIDAGERQIRDAIK